ncbi:hypothetical protein AVEN_102961-1 [Araneus ventricosus]|uniref:Uncharacterized protein n=1 Tax=Araneus ventricosus TaxID=182803 RepID=A0A4Y2BAH9_ARAVE|nr:hypothetical protein AVEN_102961-1 [Araneus ventricosus]
MRSRKQTERQQLLMESSLAYPRGKEEKDLTQKGGKNSKVEQTLGHLGVVNPVTSKEDVPLRGVFAGNQPIDQYLSVSKDSFSNPPNNGYLEETVVVDWSNTMKFKAS